MRKLSVGVASVLVGLTFMGVNQQASADTTTNQNSTVGQNLQETNDQQDLQAKQVVLTNTPADQQEQANQENETAPANTQVATTA